MVSAKLMGSSSDLNRKLSSCASTEFIRFDSSGSNGGDNFAPDYLERNSGREPGHRPGLETESSSSTLLSTEIAHLDATGAIAPISDGEFEPRRVVRRTVDDVWREIVAGKRESERQKPKEEMMTLEEFLVMAGAAEEEVEEEEGKKGILEVKEERTSGVVYDEYDSKSEVGVGGGSGRGRVKRSLSLMEPLDKAAQQRKRRMIKNRESAARSRERKQAYRAELESMVARLEEENEQLLKEMEQQKRKRLKQLMENVIPVLEKRRPPRLRRVRSMQW